MNTVTSFGTTPSLDRLLLPDGRRVSEVDQGPLYGEFDRLAVPGFRHQLGRTDAIAGYGRFLQSIFDEAGQKALDAFMAANRSI